MSTSSLPHLSLAGLLLWGAAAAPVRGQASADTLPPEIRPVVARADAQAQTELAKDGVGSVTLGVVFGGKLAWTRSYGLADSAKEVAATADTIYRIGSVTKSFTALMLLQLVEQGKVHLSDPVEKYVPEIAKVQGRIAGTAPISLIQLATHTSGLDREPEDTETYLKGPVADWEKVTLAALPQTHFAFEPGSRFSYSNIGYAILGLALERAANQPYVDYVREHIFRPLGMNDTYFEPNEAMRPRLAKGYVHPDPEEGKGTKPGEPEKIDAETAEREHLGRGYKVPNGAVYTTVADLARYVVFELGGGPEGVLKKESREEIFAALVTTGPGFGRGYGTGFQAFRFGSVVVYGHSGGVAGYETQMFFHRPSGIGLLLFRNAIGGSFDSGSVLRAAFETLDFKGAER